MDITGKETSVPLMKSANCEQECIRSTLLKKDDVEDFYTTKLQDFDERNASLQTVTDEAVNSSVASIEQKFLNLMTAPICQNLQFKVMECFQVNPLEILNCSALVNEFTACVDRTRVEQIISHMKEKEFLESLRDSSDKNELRAEYEE